MKVSLIFAEEWTTKALEKDPENIGLTGNRTLTKWHYEILFNKLYYLQQRWGEI